MRFVSRILSTIVIIAGIVAAPEANAAKHPSAAASTNPAPSSSPGASSSPGPSSPSGQNSGQSPGAAPAGGNTGGSLPIESTILAYEALQASANSIANAIGPNLVSQSPPSKLLIATQNDTTAILQLRVVLAQAHLLNSRVDNISHLLGHLQCARPKVAGGPPRPSPIFSGLNLNPVGKLFATPSDISAMVAAAASISATTESLTTASGNLGDVSLMNLVAGNLTAHNPATMLAVYVPSMLPPHVYGIAAGLPDLRGTYLYTALNNLEWSRNNLQFEANNTIGTKACSKDPNVATAKDLVAGATTAVDAFESSLFGASASAPSASGQPAAPQAGTSYSSPVPLAQLLSTDLMLHQVVFPQRDPATFLNDLYLLSVHALESGGSQLTKQQLFLGSRSYYSGGAVAAFSLFNEDGSVMCTGVTFGYRGFIRAGDVTYAIAQPGGSVSPPGTQNLLPNTMTAAPPVCRRAH